MNQIRLAFSGSGFLAPIHAGAACAFLDAGIEIVEVAGTSGGSIIAALLATGISSADLKEIALQAPPRGVMRFQLLSLVKRGINNGRVLHKWLHEIIGHTPFNKATIPVTIMATEIAWRRGFTFDAANTPYIPLADACRASASVPFVWTPFRLCGTRLVDGGMVCNIPTDKLVDDHIMRVGIQVTDTPTKGSVDTFIGYAKQCIGTLLEANENNLVAWAEQTGAEIISVNSGPYGFLDANLPQEAREYLFNKGYRAVSEWLHLPVAASEA